MERKKINNQKYKSNVYDDDNDETIMIHDNSIQFYTRVTNFR